MKTELIISGDDLSTRKINKMIKEGLKDSTKRFIIENDKKLDSLVVGIREEAEFILKGEFGDFIGALNDGAKIKIMGNTGRYLGDNMTAGEIIVEGSAKDGVGFGTYNGTIVIYGDAGNGVGQLNKGGTIIIDGDIKDLAGLYMLSGDIIVTGNAGKDTGDWIIGGNIYVAGDFETGTNAKISQLEKEDTLKLSKLFYEYGIEAEVEEFKKIHRKKLRPFYG
ncbi:MAG TPA: tributyrin esterase [Methanobacteriales archaeon]|nr:MAG: putative glutamate synthase subunit [Methanobacteriaceae archaeon 41_258]HIH62442.1 tributyrin esterase [Methanobacteriales archaeon]